MGRYILEKMLQKSIQTDFAQSILYYPVIFKEFAGSDRLNHRFLCTHFDPLFAATSSLSTNLRARRKDFLGLNAPKTSRMQIQKFEMEWHTFQFVIPIANMP
jgi:hypothetical protein